MKRFHEALVTPEMAIRRMVKKVGPMPAGRENAPMSMALLTGLTVAAAILTTLVVQLGWIKNAPRGWLDKTTFHFGEEPYVRKGNSDKGKTEGKMTSLAGHKSARTDRPGGKTERKTMVAEEGSLGNP